MFDDRSPRAGLLARASRALLPLLVVAIPAAAAADEGPKTKWRVGPFVNARATDAGQSADVGIEVYPTNISTFGGRLTAIVKKADPDKPPAEASSERFNFGLRLQLLAESGRGEQTGRPISETPDVSVFGAALDASWTFGKYDYKPGGGEQESAFEHSWKLEARGWWFTTVGTPMLVRETTPPVVVSGTPVPVRTVSYAAWLAQPQIRVSYEQRVKEADDSYLLRPPNDDGLQLSDKVKLDPPSIVPSASILVAVPFSPPLGRFGFAPAFRITTRGDAGGGDPFAALGRGRLELWLYYFGFNDGPAVRVGVAPFLDARVYGDDKRDELVGGAVIELRASTARLEY